MYRNFVALVLMLSITLTGFSQNRNSWLFGGTWEGKGYQVDSDSTWTMKFRIEGNKYLVEYPSLKCGGEWKLISINSKEATFRERISYGNECAKDGLVVIQRLSNRQILFLYSNQGSNEIVASVILNRRLQEGR